jgi:hypothetical protein
MREDTLVHRVSPLGKTQHHFVLPQILHGLAFVVLIHRIWFSVRIWYLWCKSGVIAFNNYADWVKFLLI